MNNSNNLIVDRKSAKKHKKKLNTILTQFFAFLDRKPQPSNEEVRSEFKKREFEWKAYCIHNSLDIRTSMMFNAKVSYEWERKYVRKNN
jgi:hypothetical protein